jgi:hypothetical protein
MIIHLHFFSLPSHPPLLPPLLLLLLPHFYILLPGSSSSSFFHFFRLQCPPSAADGRGRPGSGTWLKAIRAAKTAFLPLRPHFAFSGGGGGCHRRRPIVCYTHKAPFMRCCWLGWLVGCKGSSSSSSLEAKRQFSLEAKSFFKKIFGKKSLFNHLFFFIIFWLLKFSLILANSKKKRKCLDNECTYIPCLANIADTVVFSRQYRLLVHIFILKSIPPSLGYFSLRKNGF